MKTKIEQLGKVSITVEEDYHDLDRTYDKLTVVEDEISLATYISRQYVPAQTPLNNRHFWICLGRIDANAVAYITAVRAQLDAIIQQAAGIHDGASAYQIAVEHGFVGTEEEWLLSLVGAQGEQGIQGPIGPQGPAGPSGSLVFPSIELEPHTGELVISDEDLEDNFDFDYETGELIFNP